MTEEECKLVKREREDLRRNELLMASQAKQIQRVQPGRDGVAVTMSQVVGRRKPQRCTAGCWMIIADCGDSEMLGCLGYGRQVCFIDAGVPDGLPSDKGAIT